MDGRFCVFAELTVFPAQAPYSKRLPEQGAVLKAPHEQRTESDNPVQSQNPKQRL